MIVLASSSPYRQKLLQRLNIKFVSSSPDVDEDVWKKLSLPPQDLAQKLSFEKAHALTQQYPNACIIGADQVAELDGLILSKPMNTKKHIEMLRLMQGKTHRLWNGVTVLTPEEKITWVHETQMTMRTLTDQEIQLYVDRQEALDCAGGYKIESYGITLFEKIQTDDPSAIEGLPLMSLYTILKKLGYC